MFGPQTPKYTDPRAQLVNSIHRALYGVDAPPHTVKSFLETLYNPGFLGQLEKEAKRTRQSLDAVMANYVAQELTNAANWASVQQLIQQQEMWKNAVLPALIQSVFGIVPLNVRSALAQVTALPESPGFSFIGLGERAASGLGSLSARPSFGGQFISNLGNFLSLLAAFGDWSKLFKKTPQTPPSGTGTTTA
jgi:hypothetical protein